MSRDNNRAAMPGVARMVDELRAQGLEVRVIWASENRKEVGRMPEYRNTYELEPLRFKTGGKK